jgi:hypothetical protein
MKLQSVTTLAALALAAGTGAALAHHSFAMFDAEHPIEVSGVVKEFRFVSPHTLLILEVKGKDGNTAEWMLEGGARPAGAADARVPSDLRGEPRRGRAGRVG